MPISGDNPIENVSEDLIGRQSAALAIAEEIRTVDASKGCVIGIMGPWGSGKTSLVNLVQHELAKDPALPVLDFNPWMFSGAEQLVDSFFRELAAQLKVKKGRLEGIASQVEAYGDLLSPIGDALTILGVLPFGGMIGRARNAAGALRNLQERRKRSVTEQRKLLSDKLAELDRPIVVVLDDIDRLLTSEIRDIFRLVRLTASFPNIIYLVAFDRKRVEEALNEIGVEGRAYLEKIVQVTFDIPILAQGVLLSQLGRALGDALEDFEDDVRFDRSLWTDVLAEVVLPLVRNMRDVRRYCASARTTIRAIRRDIELVDLLALEAVRVFLPDVFAELPNAREALTKTGFGDDSPILKAQFERLLEVSATHDGIVSALVSRLFPAASRYLPRGSNYGPEWRGKWLTARRVAHIEILNLYLERVAGEKLLAFDDAELAFTVLDKEIVLDAFLRSIDLNRLEDVIAALENYEGQYPAEAVQPAVTVLLNLMPILPERPRSFLGADTRIVVTRVVLRLLRQLSSADAVQNAVRAALPRISTLSSRFQLIIIVGYRENAGHKLIAESEAEKFEAELSESVRSAEPAELEQEWDLLRLLWWLQSKAPEGTSVLPTSDDLALNVAILRDARGEVLSQSLDSRALKRQPRLQWDLLVRLYGSEEALGHMIGALRDSNPTDPSLVDAIALAERYLTGWRPKDFDDDD